MKHFKAEGWVDFVNGVTSTKQRQAMKKHLATDCGQCMETVALWEKLHKTAALEASYQPPDTEVRIAKAAFVAAGVVAQREEKQSGLAELMIDSFLQPLLAGARSGASGVRQMLYRADPYQIDIQIETMPGGNGMVVTGQLLDVSSPVVVGRDVEISLSNRRGNTVHTVTNQFGEFRGEIENTGDLELSFSGRGEKSVVISLRNALGNLPGSKA